MKRLHLAGSVLFVLIALPAMAAAPAEQPAEPQTEISPGEVSMTPEMWFYQQYQRESQDPKSIVRRNAEFRGEQRRQRLAAQQWYGKSNQRPQVSHDPFNSDWSPTWTSGSSVYPFRYNASASRPVIVIAPGLY